MEFRKVHPGDPLQIPAHDYNAFVDAAIAHRQSEDDRSSRDDGRAPWPACVVIVRNDSGDDVERFAVLGIEGIVFTAADNLDEFQNRPALKCVTPTSSHQDKFVIVTEPIIAGELGRAVIAGVTPAKVNVQSETDRFASPSSGAVVLSSAASGSAQILYKEPGTGEQWAIVRFPVGGSTTLRWAMITAVEGDAPPFLYSGQEAELLTIGRFQAKAGGTVFNRNLYNAGEVQYPGAGRVPIGTPVLIWPGNGDFRFVFPWYRGTYG